MTVTTVGYGDIVPGSTAGRLFGSVLILMGIGLFSMMTASFSAFFMQQEEEDLIAKETANADRLAKMESRMEQLETKLDQLLTIALEAEQQRREQGRDLDGGER
ncbi:MAG: hypothetical protein COW58_11475 [Thalassolituus sp. CG17_big_fil_post_rev_8_21_14_2_50_53_8]|nr:MAG: hypothetical protein COW58_11475 [Thalassolituus sp. CG17_big_fil_post_rev_8_21_14_2_50_53_8]